MEMPGPGGSNIKGIKLMDICEDMKRKWVQEEVRHKFIYNM